MKSLVTLALALGSVAPLAAQGWIEGPTSAGQAVARVRTAISVQVTGHVARVSVEEWFQNRGGAMAEGDYVYPLPGEAVFANFSLFQGDRELRGETMDAAQARSIYEAIVRRKKDPALIELVGHGMLRARVFPINAGETRKITLRYTQLMSLTGDALQFRYTAGARGRDFPVVPVDRPAITREATPLGFELVADSASAFRDPFSPTHELRTTRNGDRLTVRPEGPLSGDLVVFLPLARGLVGLSAAMHRPSGEDGYFMLTVSPGRGDGHTLPRDITAVVDVSGSMSGEKISQARAALHQLMQSLNRDDRFRLIAFSGQVESYRSDWTRATRDEITAADRWIDQLSAEGGTNIAGALTEAFRMSSPEGRLPLVLFMTDGLPSVGEQNPERIAALAERSRGNARVFAFGVGFDVNTYLLDRLSAAGRGSTQYVQSDAEVERAVGTLVQKISQPVLTDLAFGDTPVTFREVYPAALPDLFAGEDLVVFGRYRDAGGSRSGSIVVTGRRNGRVERFSVNVTFPDHETGNDFVPRLWAARKVGVLSQSLRLNGPNPEIERDIRETALRYGILTEFTSYLVQEPDIVANRPISPPMFDRRGNNQSMVAPAPASASGQGAVMAADQARARRETKSAQQVAAMEEQLAGKLEKESGRRAVGGRIFAKDGETWVDQAADKSLRQVQVAPFSAAYFAVLRALPELEPYFSTFERVSVTGARVSLVLAPAPSGLEQITQSDLERLVLDFRGRKA